MPFMQCKGNKKLIDFLANNGGNRICVLQNLNKLIIFVFCTKIRAILCYCRTYENNLSHIDNEEISVKGKNITPSFGNNFNLLWKSNII